MIVLRPHQIQTLDQINNAIAAGDRRLVVQSPTGSGKTILATQLVQKICADGGRVIFTVPTISLIDQTAEKFYREGIREFGVIQADHAMTNATRPIQIASIQTLARIRADRRSRAADVGGQEGPPDPRPLR
jgi:superfamily II DNA or RNA helicase